MERLGQPYTPYTEVNAALDQLLAGIQSTLGERLVGLYLHGSLALGDFAPLRSDVDFVAVTEGDLPNSLLSRLRQMHARLTASGLAWAKKLEGSYIPRAAIRRYEPARATYPALRVDGSFDLDFHGSDALIQRHVLREHGIVLAGPSPKDLIDPIDADALRRSARGILLEWWAPQLIDHAHLADREYQAYAALTMCRICYTIAHGDVVSKPAAAGWFLAETGPRWRELINRALAWPQDPQPDDLPDTLALIRDTLEISRTFQENE